MDIKIADNLKIKLKDREYDIETKKILYVLKRLSEFSGKKINCDNEKELIALMKEYKIYNEEFLENINKYLIP